MITASVLLGLLAVALAWPIPIALSTAGWPSRAPATALVLWQAVALAGGLSMIGALVVFGLAPFGERLLPAAMTFAGAVTSSGGSPDVPLVNVLGLAAGILLGVHLVFTLVLTMVRIERQRRRHRSLVRLLSAPVPDQPNTRLIDHPMPIAYCLPDGHSSVTVFSAGLLDLLDRSQIAAVIDHEKAHLLQRHYLVLLAFDAWRTSLPWFPTATRAEREVGMLVEMLADDRARLTSDDAVLASAIALVAEEERPAELAVAGLRRSDTRRRVERLVDGSLPLGPGQRALVWTCAVSLVAVPALVLFLG